MSIAISDLTGGEAKGRGAYDEIMRAVKTHIIEEYDSGRITQQDYTGVYLGALQTVLGISNQFTLQAPISTQQELLLIEQVKQAKNQNLLLDLQREQLRIANETAQYNLDEIMPLQKEQLLAQNLLTNEQYQTQVAQTAVVNLQDDQLQAQIALTGKQEDLVDEQIKTETANTSNATGGQAKALLDKTLAEESILVQKLETEKAQTEGTAPGVNPATDIGGLIGYEMTLKNTQSDSFLRDAEQKANKFYADIMGVAYSTSPDDFLPSDWGYSGTNSEALLTTLFAGVGTSFTP